MASMTRNISMSLEYRVYQILNANGWVTQLTNAPLAAITGDGVPPNTFGLASGKPWNFFALDGVNGGRQRVEIRRNGVVVPNSQYVIDFRNARMSFKAAAAGAVTATVQAFAANVREGYPDEEWLKLKTLPVVSHEVDAKNGTPFAVGTGARDYAYPCTIDILAYNDGQRKDLMDHFTTQIKSMPILNCSSGWILGGDGDVNADFDFGTQLLGWARMGDVDPAGKLLAPRQNGSDKEKFRATVYAQFKNVE